MQRELMPRTREASVKMGLGFGPYPELLPLSSGKVFLEMRDARSDEVLEQWEKKNCITRDAGIVAARLHKNSLDPVADRHNGIYMLAVGTGATGNILNPDAPQTTQRKLNVEIARKTFSSAQYRNGDGVAVAYPTNIVDFTTVFGESEAVGALNEMGLLSPYSHNPYILNLINNGPSDYNPTIDVSAKDLFSNYLTFGCLVKPATAVLSITWRFTFGG